jgi:hypothetical protein
MIYQLFSFLQLLGIIWFNMLSGTDISVSTNIPSQMNPGDEIIAEITINKGSVAGFVKFQQDFPEGFLVSEVDSKGGNFSFLENSLKIVWISFPSENEVKIKYKLSALSNAIGPKTINGKISYLDNNDKKVFSLTPIALNIGAVAEQTVEKTIQENTPVQKTDASNSDVNITSEKTSSTTNSSQVGSTESNGPIKCKRELINISSTEVLIKFTVDNTSGLKGFAKLEDVIPMGFNVKLVQSKGASFSFINQKVRILWLEMPSDPVFSCSYKIIKAEAEANSIDLEGLFSYLNDGKGVSVQIMTPGVEFKENPNAAQEIAAAVPAKNVGKTENQNTKKVAPAETTKSVTTSTTSKISTSNSSGSSTGSSSGIYYKVQVCAVRKTATIEAVSKELQLSESLDLEMHDGWHKFTFGNFSTYATAKEKRNEKSNLSTQPFVTSYNNGSRITVQEGLMISNQAWLK